jgi:hypothetical protein
VDYPQEEFFLYFFKLLDFSVQTCYTERNAGEYVPDDQTLRMRGLLTQKLRAKSE